METFAELLLQFPKEGWFRLVRSATNYNKWWCIYESIEEIELKIMNEKWEDTPEEAMKGVLERLRINKIIE